jgi:hypothetical protein
MKEARERIKRLHDLTNLRRAIGDEEFVAWCQENGEDYQMVLDAPYEMSLHRSHQEWLESMLDGGQDFPVSELKALAFEAQVVSSEQEWHRLECYASRQKYTKNGPYGTWKK